MTVDSAEALQDERARMRAHPGIVFRDGPAGRRPGLAEGPDLWEVARLFEQVRDPSDATIARVADWLALSVPQVRAAAVYYSEYGNEVDPWIRAVDELAEELSKDE
jgi:hypothetical protein